MKLDKKYLNKCYHDAMIMQYQHQLREQGYDVSVDKQIAGFNFDLYAEKNDKKMAYEFKVIGGAQQGNSVEKFKECAKSVNAEAIIVYVTPPDVKNIEFDGLADIILSEFDSVPEELDILSTHTSIQNVMIGELTSITLNDSIKIKGNAMLSVRLQYGSDGDLRRDNGVVMLDEYPMKFQIELDHELSVLDFDYDIDTSSWDRPNDNLDYITLDKEA